MNKSYLDWSEDCRIGQHHPGHISLKTCKFLGIAVALSVILFSESPALAAKTFLDFQTSSTSNPAPANWNVYTPRDVLDDLTIPLFDELNNPTGISFRFDLGSAFWVSSGNTPVYASYTPSGLDLSEFDEGISIQTVGQRMEFTGLTPGQSYDFWMLGWTYDESFSPPMDFSVSGAGAWTAIDHPSQAYLAINGQYGTTSRAFDSYAQRFIADATGVLSFESVSGDFTSFYGAVLEPVESSPHQTATLFPAFDVQAEWNGASFDIQDGDTVIYAGQNSSGTTDDRAVMEFNISGIPDDATITSLSLSIDPWLYSSSSGVGGPRVRVYGYGGNGVPNSYDAENTAFLLAEGDELTNLDPIEIELDPTILQLMLPNSDYMGLVIRGSANNQQLGFGAQENTFSPPPTLSIGYSILLEGDLNGDGFVGVDDLNIVLLNWNQNVTPGDLLSGDTTGEGFVGVDDLNIILVNWNTGTPPDQQVVIPEPGAITILGVASFTWVIRRRRRCA